VEACLVLLIAIVLGCAAGIMTVLPLAGQGIDLSALAVGMDSFGMPRVIYPLLSLGDLVGTGLIIFLLGALVSLYPALKAARFTAVEALTHV